jgi:hypothetical protein
MKEPKRKIRGKKRSENPERYLNRESIKIRYPDKMTAAAVKKNNGSILKNWFRIIPQINGSANLATG